LRTGEITLSIESQFRNVFLIGIAVNQIAAFNSISRQSAFELEVAVVEAVNNAVEYAHHHNREKVVTVRVQLRPDRIKFTVIDSGDPFNFKAAMAAAVGLEDSEHVERGRGLKIIEALVDEIKYKRRDNKNHITLVKYLRPN